MPGKGEDVRQEIAAAIYARAGVIAGKAVRPRPHVPQATEGFVLDPLLASPRAGLGVMALLLTTALWLTLVGANYPSELLAKAFSRGQNLLSSFLNLLGTPPWLGNLLVYGVYRTASWVVAVMLPPMAIFFPCFTLLEDLGYLPRLAFTLDRVFYPAGSQGRQALTMCMGLGCNAAGVVACRIIDSPRERLIAILTNVFVPCNGRFPTMIALTTLFLTGPGPAGAFKGALTIGGLILLGTIVTLAVSWFLAHTLARGVPSAFVLELPPYRRPRVLQVVVRSLLDRTLFVLGRAVAVAAPAGGLIWVLANVPYGGQTLLAALANWLDPFGRALGLDGFILTGFFLGWPANEIVLPITLMGYLTGGTMIEPNGLADLGQILIAQGWTWLTALCFLLFSLLHFPCATTTLTTVKEAGGRWAVLGFFLPLAVAVGVTFIVTQLTRLCGMG